MKARHSITAGTLVVAIGVLHTAVGVLLGAAPLQAIVRGGYISAVDGHFDRMAIFWFLMFGFVLMLVGDAFRAIEHAVGVVPPRLGWMLGAVSLAGAAAMPVSGFWLALIPTALILGRARQRSHAGVAAG